MPVKDLIYDVGLHRGEDTSFYLAKGFRVVAFEADPDLAAECRIRFSDEVASRSLVIVEGAVVDSDQSRPISFYKNQASSVWGTVSTDWMERNEAKGASSQKITVKPVNFAACLDRFGIPHYMKVDIEGMDRVCFEALRDFDDRPNFVSLESEKVQFSLLQSEIDLLCELGYDRFKAIDQSRICGQREPRDTREGRYAGLQFDEGSSGLFGCDLPGQWLDRGDIIRRYRKIFKQYTLLGDRSLIRRYAASRFVIRRLESLVKRRLPGWYDTHAVHSSYR